MGEIDIHLLAEWKCMFIVIQSVIRLSTVIHWPVRESSEEFIDITNALYSTQILVLTVSKNGNCFRWNCG